MEQRHQQLTWNRTIHSTESGHCGGHSHLSLVEEGDDFVVERLLPLRAALAREGSLLFLHGTAPLQQLCMQEEGVGCLHPVMTGLVQLCQMVDVPEGGGGGGGGVSRYSRFCLREMTGSHR